MWPLWQRLLFRFFIYFPRSSRGLFSASGAPFFASMAGDRLGSARRQRRGSVCESLVPQRQRRHVAWRSSALSEASRIGVWSE